MVRLEPITNSKIFDDRHFYDDLSQIISSYVNGTVNPQSTPGTPGSGTSPDLLKIQQPLFQPPGGPPSFNNPPFGGGPNPNGGLPQPPNPGTIPVPPGQNPNPHTTNPPSPPPSGPTVFIWKSTEPGNWPTDLADWISGVAPNSPNDQVIIEAGTSNYNIPSLTSISFLTVDSGATLEVTAGQLTTGGLIDDGTIVVDGDPPALVVNGPATIGSTGKIKVVGKGSEVDFNGSTVDNQGLIASRHGGIVDFNIEGVTNETGAKIVASGKGSQINFLGTSITTPDLVANSGLIAARHHGEILFRDSFVTNELGGEIKSTGHGSEIAFGDALGGADFANLGKVLSRNGGAIDFVNASVDNEKGAIIEAGRGGEISFSNTEILNETKAIIEAVGCGALITITDALVTNPGKFLAAHGGTILFGATSGGVQVDNQDKGSIVADGGTIGFQAVSFTNQPDGSGGPGGKVESTNWGLITFQGGSFTNGQGALVEADHHGSIFFEGFPDNPLGVTNNGKLEASGCGSVIRLQGQDVSVTNDGGTFVAKNYGEIVFDALSGVMNEDGGKIEARDHGIVSFIDLGVGPSGSVLNDGGVIGAFGCGSKVELDNTTIVGGTLKTRDGGLIEVVAGQHNTFLNVTLDHAVVRVDRGTSLALEGGNSGLAAVIDGKVTFEGRGVVTMAVDSYKIVAGTDGGTLINKTTILGVGQIGIGDGQLIFVNDGTVEAHSLGGGGDTFVIDTSLGAGGAATTINRGTLEACGSGIFLLIENTTLDNRHGTIEALHHGTVELDDVNITGGTIKALRDGVVKLDDATITGSTLDTSHGGVIETVTTGAGDPTSSIFDNVTNDGYVLVQSNTTLKLEGTIHNNGTIVVDPVSGAGADLQIDGKVVLDGWGVVKLDGRSDEITGTDGGKLINRSTIEGYGQIGTGNKDLTLQNKAGGAIDADVRGEKLIVDTGANTIDNAGLLEATRGGILDIKSNVANRGGTIEATERSVVTFEGASLTNGAGALVEAEDRGSITFEGGRHDPLSVTNDRGGKFVATGCDSTISFLGQHVSVTNDGGTFVAKDHGEIVFDGISRLVNEHGGKIEAKDRGTILVEDISVINGGGGKIEAADCGSVVAFCHDSVTNKRGGTIVATDFGTVAFDDDTVANKYGGTIEARDRGAILFDRSHVDNDHGAQIRADGWGSEVTFDHDRVDNSGSIDAAWGGTVQFDHSRIDNGFCAVIAADGCGSEIKFNRSHLDNSGRIGAQHGGEVSFDRSSIDNERHGSIEAEGWRSEVEFRHSDLGNSGRVEATDGGIVLFECSRVDNDRHGTIEAKGRGSEVSFFGSKIDNWGSIAATLGGAVLFEYSQICNARGATIDADGHGSEVTVDRDLFANSGRVDADQRGTVLFENSFVGNERHGTIDADGPGSEVKFERSDVANAGAIAAEHGGTVLVDRSTIDNWHGTIEAVGCDSTVDLDRATIVGGTLETKSGGLIQTVSGTSTLEGVTIAHDSDVDVGRGTTLTLSGGTTMLGGTLVVEHRAVLDIEGHSGATLDGVNVINDGNIEIDRPHERTTLVLENGTTISGGDLTIGHRGELDIEGGRHGGATLDGVDVTNHGVIQVDDSAPATLHLTDGTIIHDGTLSIGCYGTVDIESRQGATLDDVSVWNDGTITFGNEHGGDDPNLVIGGTVRLHGEGNLVLAGSDDHIVAANGGGELVNDSNIVGAGSIGNGSESLTLDNESCGTIDADLSGRTLTIDTGGNQITNAGTLAASNGGILDVDSAVNNAGGSIKVFDNSVADFAKSVTGGTATIEGGTLKFEAAADLNVTFDNGPGGNHYGELVLDDWKDFSGTISGFTGHESEHPSLTNTDEIDLAGFKDGRIIDTTVTSGGIVTLILEDKAGDTIDLNFDDPGGALQVKSDGHNGTLIYDPPAASTPSPSVSIGGAGNDTFVFQPGMGAETINNFNAQTDTIELDHFANIQNIQQLAALVTTDGHGDAMLELGHNDSITIPGMTPSNLQAHLQSMVHLH